MKQSLRLTIFGKNKMMRLNCVLIGAGNLAVHLGAELHRKGFQVVQVYSRTEESAKYLANKLGSAFTFLPEEIISDAGVYFIALKDSAVGEVLPKINFQNKLLVHCSGSLPLEVLKSYSLNYGVLYPLQTFSKNRGVDFSEIPVFVEANTESNLRAVLEIAVALSSNVKVATSEERLSLHLAAVFACNFVNHFYSLADLILAKNGFSFDILKPLILETAGKIRNIPPKQAQTGPAVRFDQSIIDKHLESLAGTPELAHLYKTISKSIFDLHKKKE